VSAPDEWLSDGGISSAAGFSAGGTYTGIKEYGDEPRLDLGLLTWPEGSAIAAVFTRNAVQGASIKWNRALLAAGHTPRALLCNSGNANTATGDRGDTDCRIIAEAAAKRLNILPEEVIVASTGVIGRLLQVDRIERGIEAIDLSDSGGAEFARAILTTDTVTKEIATRIEVDGIQYTIAGCAKGSGMIHPDMGTMFAFMVTDAPAESAWLEPLFRDVIDRSFNMIDIDMDTSTSDTALLIASGAAGGSVVSDGHPAAEPLRAAIEATAIELARRVTRDGEGATALIEVVAEGAASEADARLAARTIASSPLVKTMITGRDPNWGRVMMAAGRSGASVDQMRASVWIGAHCVLQDGAVTDASLTLVSQAMDAEEVQIRINLGTDGSSSATAWGCNLTTDYVHINADYTT
jgi:glutamate N-acetyltransferase/amino-acid N-acetyltransferase